MLLSLVLCGPARAAAPPDPGADLEAERDQLIERIAKGVRPDEAARRFKAISDERDRRIATQLSLHEQERLGVAKDREAIEKRRAWTEAYQKTVDYEVSWRCTLSPDPKSPIPSKEGRFRPDWGKVARKELVRLPPKNELDEGEQVTLYEVAGEAGRYVFRGERFGPRRDPVQAKVGDLMIVCEGGRSSSGLPPGWSGTMLTSGFAAPIAAPPLIVKKARWQPIHITGSAFFWAIKDVRWKYPPDGFVLSNIEIGRELPAEGAMLRYEIEALQNLSWVLEVPRALPRREVLVPGRRAWVILGRQRFDKDLKKLVLVAEDVEERYVRER